MKISFSKVLDRGQPAPMVIYSLDQALYQVMVVLDGREHLLTENDGRTFRRHSLAGVCEALQVLPVAELRLRQQSAYDEMIGQPMRQGDNALEVPLSLELCKPPTKH